MTDTPLILIVDDNPPLQRATVRLLSRAGYRTCTADDGQAALRLARSEKPDLILLDVVLPDISGLEVCCRLKADPALTGCFVVMLSSVRIDSPSQVEGLDAGADSYIVRPIPNDELLARVRGLLRIKHAEDQLRESEECLREVLENSLDASYKRNLRTNAYNYLSPVFARLSGYTSDEMKTLPIETVLDLIHPDDRAEIDRVIARSMSGPADAAYQVDYRFKHKDGQYRWLQDRFTVARDAEGRPAALIGSVSDITDRQQAEASLRESEARATALLNTIPDMVFRIDRQGIFLGYKAEEKDLYTQSRNIVGKQLRDITPPEFTDLVVRQIRATLEIGELQMFEYQLPVPDRGVRDYEARMVASGADEVTVFVRDITERKQAEAALRESDEKYRTLTNNANESIIVTQDGLLEFVNPMTLGLLGGYSEQELIDRPFPEFVHPDDRSMVVENYRRRIANEAVPLRYAFRVVTHEGLVKWVEISAALIKWQGKPATLNFLTDITERKQAEAALRRAHDELDHRARELAALNKANQIIASTLDLDVVLRLVMNEVRTLLNAEGASVLLYDPPGSNLIFAAAAGPDSDKLVGTRLPAAAGIAGWALQHGQPARIDNPHADPRFYDRIDTLTGVTTRSLLVVPLAVEKTRHQVTTQSNAPAPSPDDSGIVVRRGGRGEAEPLPHQGVIEVVNKIGGVFDDHDLELLESMARSAALAIENARLYRAEQQQREFSETLREIGAVLVTTLDVDTVLDRLLEQVQRVIPYDAANIMLIAGDRAQVTRWRGYEQFGTEDAISAVHLLITGTPILRQMLETGAPLFIADTKTDANWIRTPESDWLQSYASAPIRVRDEIIGFLSLGSITAGFFGPLHAEQLSAFAGQAAIALENARLYQIEREQFERLQQSQAQLIQAEKMSALGRLAAALAHEINNPLQAIQSHLELVMDFPVEAGERLEYLQIARQEINRLSQLTRNVLSFARPMPGPRRLASIDDLIRQTLALAGKQLEHNHIQVTTDLQPTPSVFMAAEQLTQVFLNLVLNAAEAIQHSGQIHITSRVERDQIAISFIDDGPAIKLEDLPHIFEPFYTTKPGGTGLGLSISHRLVQQHGGSLIAENVTDTRGVVFKISLPVTASSESMSIS